MMPSPAVLLPRAKNIVDNYSRSPASRQRRRSIWRAWAAGWAALMIAAAGANTPANPAPPAHWYLVSAGQADTLQQVIWTGREFLATGWDTVLSSPDGVKWTEHQLNTKDRYYSIAYNGKLYVVVGEGGVILTSPDLTQWTVCSNPSHARLSCVFAMPGDSFLAVGDWTILYSQDGSSWVSTNMLINGSVTLSGDPSPPNAVIPRAIFRYGANLTTGKYAIADDNGGVWTSSGITSWTKSLTSPGPMANVATDGTRCVAVGKAPSNLYTSPDGLNWVAQHSGTTVNLAGAAYANGEFVVTGDNGTILSSTDTTTWTPQLADTTAFITSVASNGKIFVAVTDRGGVLARLPAPNFTTAALTLLSTTKSLPVASPTTASPAGSAGPLDDWTIVSSGETMTYWQSAWLRDVFVSVGNIGAIVTSPDGVTWTKQNSKTREHFFGVTANKNLYVVVGDHGAIYTSPDLKEWTARNSGTTERIFTVVWTGTQFIALAVNTVITSPDGATWLPRPVMSENGFHHGLWTGSQLIMTTANSVAYSADGVRWITTLRRPDKMFDVATDGGGLYVAVGTASGSVFLSLDGQTWTPRPAGTSQSLSAITWTGDQFVAGGANDTLVSSPEGLNWTLHHTGTGLQTNTLATHDGTIVIGTYTGEILVNKKVATVAAPEISLAPGAPGSVPQVMLTCATPGARIYYTLDGTKPNAQVLPYTTPFTPVVATTIKARAYKDGLPASEQAQAQFTPGP